MPQKSSFTNTINPNAPFPGVGKQNSSTLDKVANTAGDVSDLLTAVDSVLNPEKYQPYQTQPQPQPQPQHQAGFAWGKWLLVAGVVGTGAYAAKKHFENKDSKKK